MTSNSGSPDKFIFEPNTIYEFTINPDDKHQFASKRDSRVRCVKSAITDILNTVSENTKYHLFPEMSFPQYGNATKNRYSRVHFHGIIMFKTPLALRKFMLNTWHQLTGMSSIQFNNYRPDHWNEYCRKQKQYFKQQERIVNSSWDSILENASE